MPSELPRQQRQTADQGSPQHSGVGANQQGVQRNGCKRQPRSSPAAKQPPKQGSEQGYYDRYIKSLD